MKPITSKEFYNGWRFNLDEKHLIDYCDNYVIFKKSEWDDVDIIYQHYSGQIISYHGTEDGVDTFKLIPYYPECDHPPYHIYKIGDELFRCGQCDKKLKEPTGWEEVE